MGSRSCASLRYHWRDIPEETSLRSDETRRTVHQQSEGMLASVMDKPRRVVPATVVAGALVLSSVAPASGAIYSPPTW
jgi:hypothetical protein